MVEENKDQSKEARAIIRYLRISPRKVRLVTRAIAWKSVPEAFFVLTALKKKAARLVEKGLKSALSNAKGKGLEESRLIVSEIKADGGPVMKRIMTRSMGRADHILKRSTHLTIILREGLRSFGPPPPAHESPEKGRKAKPEKKEKTAFRGKTRKAAAKA